MMMDDTEVDDDGEVVSVHIDKDLFSMLMPMLMMSKGGLGSESANSLMPLLLMTMAGDGDSKMSSMLPMMLMNAPQGPGMNPMLPMMLGMMGGEGANSDILPLLMNMSRPPIKDPVTGL